MLFIRPSFNCFAQGIKRNSIQKRTAGKEFNERIIEADNSIKDIPQLFKFDNKSHSSEENLIVKKDYPEIGFKGQIVSVKPGYAELHLFPRQIAIYNFPGTHARLFPNWDENEVFRKREELDLKNFVEQLNNMAIEIIKPPSAINPSYIKEKLKPKDVIDQVKLSLGFELTPQNVVIKEDIKKFGSYWVGIEGYHSERFDRTFSFNLKVTVIEEEKEEKMIIE